MTVPTGLGLSVLGMVLWGVGALGCTAQEGSPVGMRVQWLGGNAETGIPSDVSSIKFFILKNGDSIETVADRMGDFTASVPYIEDRIEEVGGRRFYRDDSLMVDPNEGVSVGLVGLDAGNREIYAGQSGPMVLSAGEVRFVDIAMYEKEGSVVPLGQEPPGRFLSTTTALADGRILVAGGFVGGPTSSTPCPTVREGTVCYALTATDEAYIFDSAAARFTQLPSPMLRARGGHTATRFGDRVLLAGGAETAVIEVTTTVDAVAYTFINTTTTDTASTFELFDSLVGDELADRRQNVIRGQFVGGADGSGPGRLNDARFMHGAALVRGDAPGANRVVLAGGVDSPGNIEVFIENKPGGYGALGGLFLSIPRPMPGVAAVADGRVFIVGGASGPDDRVLYEVWSPLGGPREGTFMAAPSGFPGPEAPYPEHALIRPSVLEVGGNSVLVVGANGPTCTTGTPDFAGMDRCGPLPGQSFTIDGMGGAVTATPTDGIHSWATAVTSTSGRRVFLGGSQGVSGPGSSVDVFTGDVGSGGQANRAARGPSLVRARAFHASAPLPHGGILTVGGLSITDSTLSAVSAPEVLTF